MLLESLSQNHSWHLRFECFLDVLQNVLLFGLVPSPLPFPTPKYLAFFNMLPLKLQKPKKECLWCYFLVGFEKQLIQIFTFWHSFCTHLPPSVLFRNEKSHQRFACINNWLVEYPSWNFENGCTWSKALGLVFNRALSMVPSVERFPFV